VDNRILIESIPVAKRSSKSKDGNSASTAVAPVKLQSPVRWRDLLPALLIVVVTSWIYWPVLHGDWLGDDSIYITRNLLLLDPDRLWKAWFQPGSFIEYYPIEQTVQWLQWKLWGTDTLWYHVTNVVLHVMGSLLVWRLLHKLGVRLAWLGGLIFAIHPMQVESVALINELKNTLSLPCFLLAMCHWIDFEESREMKQYVAAMAWFLAAMLTKITMAPFPLLILLYAWYLRGRIGGSDLKISAPFFVISIALAMVTVWSGQIYAESTHLIFAEISLGGFFSRMALAGTSLAFYFSRCFLPIQPSIMYPQWEVNPPNPWQFLPWPVLGGLCALLWRRRQGWGKPALLGLGFFLIFIAPFLGFNQVSYMATVWVMDHFLYIPIIGFIGLTCAAWGLLDERLDRGPQRVAARGAICLVLALLAYESHGYAAKFVDDETIDRYTLEVNPQAWLARLNLGVDLDNKGAPTEAQTQLEAVLALHPNYPQAYLSLATVYAELGKVDEAQKQFEEAARMDPNDGQLYSLWGRASLEAGQVEKAITLLHTSLGLDPNNPPAHMYLGIALCQQGKIPEGLTELDEAIRLNPAGVEPYLNRGVALIHLGRTSEAASDFETVLRIDPGNETAQSYLSHLYTQPGAPDPH
jgi:protein O-mannosyl-transferase